VHGRIVVRTMLGYSDYVVACGGKLAVVAGGGRVATDGKRLLVLAPPAWRPRVLWRARGRAFGSLACAPGGRAVVVLSQPSSANPAFFSTRWQLWRVGLDGSHALIDRPPPGWADESPRFDGGGSLFFVRERNGHGTLMRLGRGRVRSLGYSLGYYGHHDWAYRVS
jgi:hypothetical protein